MRIHPVRKIFIVAASLALLSGLNVAPAASQEDPSDIYEADISDQMEVLDAGPVHEAFAEPSSTDTKPGIVVPKSPPNPVQEIPPERDDLEEGSQWISGYWAWDDDRNDFIWISGIYRVPPPGREWVPGSWVEVEQGYQWISGYWADSNSEAAEYLPEPPESLDEGPNTEAPSPDYAWVSGNWVWFHGHYAWRPGYWVEMRTNWIWVPSYYVWTPMGYIFAGGYWDYAISHRGILFAPVYFYPSFFARLYFPFVPRFVIGLNIFSDCLFIRPAYRHYYFGNYYASTYHKQGIYPWFWRHDRRHGFDPIYAHQRYTHRHDRNWETNMVVNYQHQRDYENKRHSHITDSQKQQAYKEGPVGRNTNDKQHDGWGKRDGKNAFPNDPVKNKKGQNKDKRDTYIGKDPRKTQVKQADIHDPALQKKGRNSKRISQKPSRDSAADKHIKQYNAKASSYRNQRAAKPGPDTSMPETSGQPRRKYKNYPAPRQNPDVLPEQEKSPDPSFAGRNNNGVDMDQGPDRMEQNRENYRGQDSYNRSNQQLSRERRPLGQGRYSNNGRRRYLEDVQPMFNGRRR